MEIPEQVPVAIVGAGPTGLTLACMLQKAGVDVLIVDRQGRAPTLPAPPWCTRGPWKCWSNWM
jgi:2-polyprenyl-6-methoxyphenol hydroxylase-like FAD-dependent oxidoreductase